MYERRNLELGWTPLRGCPRRHTCIQRGRYVGCCHNQAQELNQLLPDLLLFKQLPHQGTATFEVYHSWMFVPVLQEDGTVGGLWNATIETTKKVLAERRLATVREMGERTCKSMISFDALA